MLGATHRDQRENPTDSQRAADPFRIIDRRRCSPVDVAIGRVHLGVAEWHPPEPALLGSHCDWRLSGGWRAGRLVHRKSDAACFRAWRSQSGSGRLASRHTPHVRNNCPRWHVTNRCHPCARANSGARSASDPKCLLAASRASAASTSCQIRSPVPSATLATESHCAARTECRRGRPDQGLAGVHPSAAAVARAKAARPDRAISRAGARQP
jgi:hypothetical protein